MPTRAPEAVRQRGSSVSIRTHPAAAHHHRRVPAIAADAPDRRSHRPPRDSVAGRAHSAERGHRRRRSEARRCRAWSAAHPQGSASSSRSRSAQASSFPPHCARCSNLWSASTSATIASITGAPRGATQGSWRPVDAERRHRRGRLEGGAQHDRLAGGDAAGDARRRGRIGIVLAARAAPRRSRRRSPRPSPH